MPSIDDLGLHCIQINLPVMKIRSGYRVAAGYACEERLDHLSVKLSRASTAQQFQSFSDQIVAANGYLGVIQDSSFVPESSQLTKFLWVVKDVLEDGSQLYSVSRDV
jgi:hypothetical protein